MNPIRILTIGHSYVLAVNRAIVREVAQSPCFDITVVAPSFIQGELRPIDCEPEPEGSPLKLVSLPVRWPGRIHIFQYPGKQLRKLVDQQPFDAIHGWEEPYVAAGYQIARLAKHSGLRYCFTSYQNLSKRYPPPFNFFEKHCIKSAYRWITGAQSVFDNLVGRGYPADRGRFITLAVDTAMFQPADETARAAVIESLGLKPPVIGYMGRLVTSKGLGILMKAVDGLDPNLPWSLLLVGGGSMQPEIENWARARGWSGRVKILLAKHHEVPRYLSSMDLLVAPSQTMPDWKEQFGRMLIEAFACGVPVIASDSGEIPYVVGEDGFIVPEKDVPAWTRTIELLLRDEALRRRTGLAGMARVRRYSAREVALQYQAFYEDLARS